MSGRRESWALGRDKLIDALKFVGRAVGSGAVHEIASHVLVSRPHRPAPGGKPGLVVETFGSEIAALASLAEIDGKLPSPERGEGLFAVPAREFGRMVESTYDEAIEVELALSAGGHPEAVVVRDESGESTHQVRLPGSFPAAWEEAPAQRATVSVDTLSGMLAAIEHPPRLGVGPGSKASVAFFPSETGEIVAAEGTTSYQISGWGDLSAIRRPPAADEKLSDSEAWASRHDPIAVDPAALPMLLALVAGEADGETVELRAEACGRVFASTPARSLMIRGEGTVIAGVPQALGQHKEIATAVLDRAALSRALARLAASTPPAATRELYRTVYLDRDDDRPGWVRLEIEDELARAHVHLPAASLRPDTPPACSVTVERFSAAIDTMAAAAVRVSWDDTLMVVLPAEETPESATEVRVVARIHPRGGRT